MVGSDFSNLDNVSDWELGRISFREGKFSEADRRFEAELTHSDSTNTLVFLDHGHLLNILGRYEDAIDKFDSLLMSVSDNVSGEFGKGISCIGLNRLDKALSYFSDVTGEDENHADAWYYSAIIYGNPFYHDYNPGRAKEYYENYQNSRESYINNPEYFKNPFDDLSLEEVHNCYRRSVLFRLIDQLLETGNISMLNGYRKLYCFSGDDLDKLSDIFRLFDDEVKVIDRIGEFNDMKKFEDKFESAGYDGDLIGKLSSQFGGLSVEDKEILVELMDYFKGSELSFTDINDLIHEYVLEGSMSLDDFNKSKEYTVENRIEDNNTKLAINVEKRVTSELNKISEENKELKVQIDELSKRNKSLSKKNDDLNQNIQKLEKARKKRSNQPNSDTEKYVNLMKEIEFLMDSFYSDNEILNNIELYLDDYKDISSMNFVYGINNEDYQVDLENLEEEGSISEEVLDTFYSAFKNFEEEKYQDASKIFGDMKRSNVFSRDELKNYCVFLEATSLSRTDELEKAYMLIEPMIKKHKKENDNLNKKLKAKKTKKEEKAEIEKKLKVKYPVGWFNFANICFDYANSQSVKNSKNVYDLSYFCYESVKKYFKEENFEYEFNFKDENSENEFKEKLMRMLIIKDICYDLEDFKDLQQKNNEDLSETMDLIKKMNGDLVKLEKILEQNENMR